MLSQSQRVAILELHAQKVSGRQIARALKVSRLTVREVLRSGTTEVPTISRAEICEPYRQQILELLPRCKSNLARVQEELAASGAHLSYSALTAFCRRHGIGQAPVVAAGRYPFQPGVLGAAGVLPAPACHQCQPGQQDGAVSRVIPLVAAGA